MVSAWLVSHIPAGLLLVLLIVVIAGGAVALQVLVRRRFPVLRREDHNDVTKFTYGVIGFVYAFFIGFVVSAMWSQIGAADGKARAEGSAAVQMARDASVFAPADADRIRASLLTYEQAAIDEWSNAIHGSSAAADSALADLYSTYRQIRPADDVQKSVLTTSVVNLDKISQARTERIVQARTDTGPPWPLWAVIFLTSAMVLGTVIIYGVEHPMMHYPMVAIVGTLVATNLFLVLQLSHPFLGGIAVSPEPLREVVAVLSGERG
ncbi:bestrophin-like domain [Mycolicibacterium confluentis]|uniref:Uncharacterized protein n=1 Tax=Mycolicibacterium confluentis TaxID=28047 RepID=A0A7I7Y3G5_9MYCO|nr:DUF4239 domain-containing protein [Mycolicibacterium confluentis]MCV7318229.1 DUF4239 domain-containing protein [Mycolicibacterium confluentis]ORV29562.1 hypothetical protein AWB99_15205 [Mycolicibacterium confluentis]BBZ36139.1 hypothetical protein MCNF_47440 [Mycolicibacterium confluentis]